jgi:hypothetical protein
MASPFRRSSSTPGSRIQTTNTATNSEHSGRMVRMSLRRREPKAEKCEHEEDGPDQPPRMAVETPPVSDRRQKRQHKQGRPRQQEDRKPVEVQIDGAPRVSTMTMDDSFDSEFPAYSLTGIRLRFQ